MISIENRAANNIHAARVCTDIAVTGTGETVTESPLPQRGSAGGYAHRRGRSRMAGTLKLVWGCCRSLPGEVMFKLGLRGERRAPGKGKACACVCMCVWGGSSGRKDRFGDPPWGWGAGSKGEKQQRRLDWWVQPGRAQPPGLVRGVGQ